MFSAYSITGTNVASSFFTGFYKGFQVAGVYGASIFPCM